MHVMLPFAFLRLLLGTSVVHVLAVPSPCLLCLFERQRDRDRQGSPMHWSPSKCLQQLGLRQAEPSQELRLGLPCGGRGPGTSAITCCTSGGSGIESGISRTGTKHSGAQLCLAVTRRLHQTSAPALWFFWCWLTPAAPASWPSVLVGLPQLRNGAHNPAVPLPVSLSVRQHVSKAAQCG